MNDIQTRLIGLLERQKYAFRQQGKPDTALRKDRIERLIDMLLVHQDDIIDVERRDFQNKSPVLIRMAEVMGSVSALRYVHAQIEEWMKPEPLALAEHFEGAGVRAEIHYQPLGTVGVVTPWNGPVILTCLPLAGILAAGNRAMIKPSELAPNTAELLVRIIANYFDETEIAVCCGGIEVGQEFIRLPFDHLLYTGSTRVARKVMAAAAENLVPVTLELGGKSPVIIGRDADLRIAAERLANGKLFHGGQVCVTPDYLFVPKEREDEFTGLVLEAAARMYPSVTGNEDYSPIVNIHHFERLKGLVDDAQGKGAEVQCLNPAKEPVGAEYSLRFPLHLLRGVNDEMHVMQEEIFGPILPVLTYTELDEVLEYVQSRPHPLSAYYFGYDTQERQRVCEGITTGSIVINDVVCQIFHEEIPFGGVGTSGMGRYRGQQGFKTFSNAVSVLTQTDDENLLRFLRPPYGDEIDGFVREQLDI